MRLKIFIFAPFAFWLSSCGKEAPRPASMPAASSVQVQLAPVLRSEWSAVYEASGTVRARTVVPLAARTMGHIRELKVNIGDHVRAGQLLVVIDSREADLSSRRAIAAREEVSSAMPEADSAIAAAQAQRDLARLTFRRMQELYEKKSVTAQEFDESSARLKATEAQLQVALARRAQLNSRLAQTEQAVASSSLEKSYAELLAPIAGVVASKNAEIGSLALPGVPLLSIEREGQYQLEAAVDESRLSSLRVGQPVSVLLDGRSEALTARLTEIAPTIDPNTRTGTAKILLPAAKDLRSGLFGRAQFAQQARVALNIPVEAVREQGQLQTVFVVENNIARSRLISLGARRGDRYEVLSGLDEKDRVISPLPAGLQDSSPIEVRP